MIASDPRSRRAALRGSVELVDGLAGALDGLGTEELAAFFGGCATREYGLETL